MDMQATRTMFDSISEISDVIKFNNVKKANLAA